MNSRGLAMDNEYAVLNKILKTLHILEKSQNEFQRGQDELRQGQDELRQGQVELRHGQDRFAMRLDKVEDDLKELKSDLSQVHYKFGVLSINVENNATQIQELSKSINLLTASQLGLQKLVFHMDGRLSALEDRFGGNGKKNSDD